MNKQAKNALLGVLIFGVTLSILFLMSFVLADFASWSAVADEGNITTFNEDTPTLLNFTVNNTGTAHNITSVNITLPTSSLSFSDGFLMNLIATGNVHLIVNTSFDVSTASANWSNNTNEGFGDLIPNLTSAEFQINISGTAPGKYNISVKITDDAGAQTERNLTIHVNDTTTPYSVTFMPTSPAQTANLSVREVTINVSANDTHSGIGSFNISLYLTNESSTANGAANSSIIHSGGALNDTGYVNFSGSHLVDGFYIINITSINDNPDLINLGTNNTNSTGVQRNITIDATPPTTVIFNSDTDSGNFSKREVIINASANATYTGIDTFNISLYLTNGSSVANTSMVEANHALNASGYVNFSGSHLVDGFYLINVTGINDTANNVNVTGVQLNITIDTVAPSITLAKSSSSDKNKLVIDIAITDSTSGVNGIACTATGGGTGNIAIGGGSDTSQTATQEGLSCSSSNVYTIKCKDHAGNTGSKEGTFSTDSCSGGGSPGGSGPGPGGSEWITTFIEDDEPLETRGSITKELAERHRVKINVVGVVHYIGIIADGLTGTSATIQVSSSHEQESTLNIGETAKVDVSDPIDNVYDLSITLNSIESNKASVTVLPLQESYQAGEPSITPSPPEEEEEIVPGELAGAARSLAWLWILIVVIGIVVVVWVVVRKRQKAG
ncbi:MAG: hypothetical protein IIA87_00645 [Nanoarchaeota archaeon]|nr:hypothetical protein [Nanoarchaeota archaeon]